MHSTTEPSSTSLHGFFFSTRWKEKPYFISPFFDFFMVGGGGLIVMLLIMLTVPKPFDTGTTNSPIPVLVFWLAFIVNDPHFISSYQLFYAGYRKKLSHFRTQKPIYGRYILAGLIIPAILLIFCLYGCYDALTNGHYYWVSYGTSLMLFFVGWHYMKQSFGVFIVLNALRKIYYNGWQRRILLWNSYTVWLFAWGYPSPLLTSNLLQPRHHSDVTTFSITLPPPLATLLLAVAVTTSLLSAGVLLYGWFKQGKKCSLNALLGYLSMYYLFALLGWIHPAWALMAPFFHSLQYLMFVFVYRRGHHHQQLNLLEAPDAKPEPAKKPVTSPYEKFYGIAFLMGIAWFFLIPLVLDSVFKRPDHLMPVTVFASMFAIFINIHHYFIDNILWRKENSEVGEYFFKWSR